MSTMYGSDVAQLRMLAARFDDIAQQFESGRSHVANAIKISAWVGPFATSFRFEWSSVHSVRLGQAAALLRENARKLRANADGQERASLDTGSTGPGGIPGHPGGPSSHGQDPEDSSLEDWMERLALALQTGDILDVVGMLKNLSALEAIGKVTGPLGVLLGVAQIADDINDGDALAAALHITATGFGIAGAVVAVANPLALGVGLLVGLIDWSIPYSPDSQDSTLDLGAERLFGRGVDRADLTPAQSAQLTQRYSGIAGAAYMISDTMDASFKRVFGWY